MQEFSIISKTGVILYRSRDKELLETLFNTKYKGKVGYKLVAILAENLDPDNKGSFIESLPVNKPRQKVTNYYAISNINEISKLR